LPGAPGRVEYGGADIELVEEFLTQAWRRKALRERSGRTHDAGRAACGHVPGPRRARAHVRAARRSRAGIEDQEWLGVLPPGSGRSSSAGCKRSRPPSGDPDGGGAGSRVGGSECRSRGRDLLARRFAQSQPPTQPSTNAGSTRTRTVRYSPRLIPGGDPLQPACEASLPLSAGPTVRPFWESASVQTRPKGTERYSQALGEPLGGQWRT
jgi:hypothetical protein